LADEADWTAFAGQTRLDLASASFTSKARDQPKRERLRPIEASPGDSPEPGSRSDVYLAAIRDLAEASETDLAFLFVPRWQQRPPPRRTYDYYHRLGEVYIPDLTDLGKVAYYADHRHLSRVGAGRFAVEVAALLEAGPGRSPYWLDYRDRRRGRHPRGGSRRSPDRRR
jgi:hypothetical protein